jgi:class 3 adenylate cyclase/tetratricopeptide (TPR) repeat protein
LFSDLSGYTAMNERLDPEEVQGVMSRIKSEAVRIVESHGGSANQFVGDEILALFGIPVAHKDDPVRAVQAVRELHEMVRRISPEVEVRLGRAICLHSGLCTGLVVTHHADDRDGRVGITGDSVNTAARLKSIAPDDTILVSPETQREILDRFELAPIEPVKLKHKDAKLTPYRVIGDSTAAVGSSRNPFVGRKTELRQIANAIETCGDSGTGQVIVVRGDPGIGKTRLIRETLKLAEQRQLASHIAEVLDFGAGRGADPIRQLVRSLMGLPRVADENRRKQALVETIAKEQIGKQREPFLYDLLGLALPEELRANYDAMENEYRNRQKRDTVISLLRAAAERSPQLVIVEDVHWADRLTLAYLAALAEATGESRAVLALTTRVAGDPLDPAWRQTAKGASFTTIDLAALRPAEAHSLAASFLEVTAQTAEQCIERAEGNPLFLEQLLLNATESAETAVPGSVQSIVLARVDQLPPEDKFALQAVSVLGQRFEADPARQLIGNPRYEFLTLTDHALLRRDEAGYIFAHALVRDGVYESLLHATRRELHRRAAEWYRERDLSVRAAHLDAAEHPDAAHAHLEAARSQAGEFHFERALGHVKRGLVLAREKEIQLGLTSLQGQLLADTGKVAESIDAYGRAVDYSDDDADRCRAWIGMAAGMRITDQYDEALHVLDQAEPVAAHSGLISESSQLHYLRGTIYWAIGDADSCLKQQKLALKFARDAGSPENEALALGGMSDALYLNRHMRSAYEFAQQCLDLCRKHGFRRIEAANLAISSTAKLYLGDLDGALADGLAAKDVAAKIGHPRAELLGTIVTANALIDMGEFPSAKHELTVALAIARDLKSSRWETQCLYWLGKMADAEGKRSAALSLVEEALTICRHSGMGYMGAPCLGLQALLVDDSDKRKSALHEGEAIIREGSMTHGSLWFYRDAIEASLSNGEWDYAEHYAKALEDYTLMESTPWSDFYIERARTLAAIGRGRRDGEQMDRLRKSRDEAVRLKLRPAILALDEALASG